MRIANIQHRQNVICKSANGNGDKSMSLRALRQFLEENGMFPDKYRSTIWRHLLDLPDNAVSFNDYVRMGTHKNFLDFGEKFPLASDSLCSRMVRILSVFAHYSPVFGDTTFTPICTIPFILKQNSVIPIYKLVWARRADFIRGRFDILQTLGAAFFQVLPKPAR